MGLEEDVLGFQSTDFPPGSLSSDCTGPLSRTAVGAGGFDFVTELRQRHVDKRMRASEFATLVATDESTEGPGMIEGAKK